MGGSQTKQDLRLALAQERLEGLDDAMVNSILDCIEIAQEAMDYPVEGKYVHFRISIEPKPNKPQPDGPLYLFKDRVEISKERLTRLAVAFDSNCYMLCVEGKDIWGIREFDVRGSARNGIRFSESSAPPGFVVSGRKGQLIALSKGNYPPFRYISRGDVQLYSCYQPAYLREDAHNIFRQFIDVTEIVLKEGEPPLRIGEERAIKDIRDIKNSLDYLVSEIANLGKGGCVVVLPPTLKKKADDLLHERGLGIVMSGVINNKSKLDVLVSMSKADGALILDNKLHPIDCGVHLNTVLDYYAQCNCEAFPRDKGTRHRSGHAFAHQWPGVMVFVISSSGSVSLFYREPGKDSCRKIENASVEL